VLINETSERKTDGIGTKEAAAAVGAESQKAAEECAREALSAPLSDWMTMSGQYSLRKVLASVRRPAWCQ